MAACPAHTRAGIADALATITPALIADAARRPPASVLHTALNGQAFNLGRSGSQQPAGIAQVLAWVRRHSLPLASRAEPVVVRHALHAITLRRDGGRAAAATITRKRAVFHNALGYPAGLGLLPANPLSQIAWRPPHPCAAGMAPGADDLTHLGSAVFQRIMRTLQARDDLLRAMNRKQDIDVAEDALITLDTCLVFLMGALDAAARDAHRVLGLAPCHVRRAGWQSSTGGLLAWAEASCPGEARVVSGGEWL